MAKSSTDAYLERTVRQDFPRYGDVWVEIRNPLRMPDAMLSLRAIKRVPVIENGVTVREDLDMEDAGLALEECVAKFVKDWHVYDESVDADKVEIPVAECNPDTLKNRVPREILEWLIVQRREAMSPPQQSQDQTTT